MDETPMEAADPELQKLTGDIAEYVGRCHGRGELAPPQLYEFLQSMGIDLSDDVPRVDAPASGNTSR